MTLFLLSFFFAPVVAMLLLCWFKKNTFPEYVQLFGLGRWFYITEFRISSENDPQLTYPKFLINYWDNWLTRLLICPVCLSVWFSAVFVIPWLFHSPLWIFPSVLAVSYVSLYLYFKLVTLMEHE